MDIHECFEQKLDRFKELVNKINEGPSKDFEAPYISDWDHFSQFLCELISGNRFREAILRLYFEDRDIDLHEKIKELFDLLVDSDGKSLVSMVYNSGYDKVTVDFNKLTEIAMGN